MAQQAAVPSLPEPYSHSRRWKLIANSAWNIVILLVTLGVLATAAAGGGSGGRLTGLLASDVLALVLPAIPLVLLMASGELDLSLASIAGLSGIIAASSIRDGGSLTGAVGLCLGLGLVVGLAHAALVGAARLNGALVTFASGALLSAIGLVLSEGKVIQFEASEGEVSLVYVIGWALALVALLAGIALVYFSPFGRRPGRNDPPEPILRRMLMIGLPYVAGGLLAGLAGVVLDARVGFATFGVSASYQLRLLLAVVIGGTSFGRGISNVFGALLGATFAAALTVMLLQIGIDSPIVSVITASLLAGALLLVHGYHGLVGWMVSRRAASSPPGGANPEPPAEQSENAPAA